MHSGATGDSVHLFHAAGLCPSADLGINRRLGGALTADLRPDHYPDAHTYLEALYHRFAQAFDRFYRFVHGLGFTIVNTCYANRSSRPFKIFQTTESVDFEEAWLSGEFHRTIADLSDSQSARNDPCDHCRSQHH
jgi:hypothetical protein